VTGIVQQDIFIRLDNPDAVIFEVLFEPIRVNESFWVSVGGGIRVHGIASFLLRVCRSKKIPARCRVTGSFDKPVGLIRRVIALVLKGDDLSNDGAGGAATSRFDAPGST
jgi:hypothetical protein